MASWSSLPTRLARRCLTRDPVTLFRQFIVRALVRDPRRSLATVAGLTLGVAVVIAIRLANAGSIRGVVAAPDVVVGQNALELVGAGVGVPEVVLDPIGMFRCTGAVSLVHA